MAAVTPPYIAIESKDMDTYWLFVLYYQDGVKAEVSVPRCTQAEAVKLLKSFGLLR